MDEHEDAEMYKAVPRGRGADAETAVMDVKIYGRLL